MRASNLGRNQIVVASNRVSVSFCLGKCYQQWNRDELKTKKLFAPSLCLLFQKSNSKSHLFTNAILFESQITSFALSVAKS